MRFRKTALALLACLAIGAFAATVADAAEGWTIGTTENQTTAGTLIPNGTHERVKCRKHGTSSLGFTTVVLGSAVEVTFEGIDCIEKAGSTNAATIDNTTAPNHSEAVLTFTGAKVVKPENCAVPGGELTTNPLTDEVIMDPATFSTAVFDRFSPEVAANGFFTLEFQGAKCPLAGNSATLNGSLCGEFVSNNLAASDKTGTLTKVQALLFGEARQATGNSVTKPCAITFGGETARIAGAVDSELESGKPFGVDGPPEGWTIGTTENQSTAGTLIPNGTHERVKCRRHGNSMLTLTANLLGSPVEITFEGIDCIEKAGSTNAATIDNTIGPDHSEAVLTFTGAKVVKPANCEVPGSEITTNQVTDEVIMDTTAGSTVVFDKFFPENVANGFFSLELQGALCPLGEISATLKGSFCGESVHTNAGGTGYEPNKTGTLTKVQALLFGEAQQKTGTSVEKSCAITVGANVAQLTGAVDTELESGKPFGTD